MKSSAIKKSKQFSIKAILTLSFGVILFYDGWSQTASKYTLTNADIEVSTAGVITACTCNFTNKDIIIPNELDGKKIKEIGRRVFQQQELTSVELPEGLEIIGIGAFVSNKLTNVTFKEPSRIEKIESLVFYDNSQLKSITFPRRDGSDTKFVNYRDSKGREYEIGYPITDFQVWYFAHRDPYTLTKDDLVVNSDGVITSCLYNFESKEIAIPSELAGIKIFGIGAGVFQNKGISVLVLPNGITKIEDNAFSNNTITNTLSFPSSLTTIGNSAFSSASLTGTLNLPSGLTTIGSYAFSGNYLKGTLNIPASVTTIKSDAFDYNQFSSITFEQPSKIEEIGTMAFANSQIRSTTLPKITEDGYRFYWKNSSNEILGESPTITNFNLGYNSQSIKQIRITWAEVSSLGKVTLNPLPNLDFGTYVTYDINTQITFTATANTGYSFNKWNFDGVDQSGNTYILNASNLDVVAKAFFEEVPIANSATLEIFVVGTGKVIPEVGLNRYSINNEVELTAQTVNGFRFDRWEVGGQTFRTLKPPKITLSANTRATAYFIQQVQLKLAEVPTEKGMVSANPPAGTYDINTEITLSATQSTTQADRFRFDKWLVGNTSYNSAVQKITLSADLTATAYFIEQIKLTFTPIPTEQGTVKVTSKAEKYDINTRVTITANPNSGYSFEKWLVGDIPYLKQESVITLVENKTITAFFTPVLAIEDLESDKISYYPNPIFEILTVETKGIVSVTLRSLISGIVNHFYPNGADTIQLDVSTLPTGFYLLQRTKTDGSFTAHKVVKY